MSRSSDLFPDLVKPRQKRKILMHYEDVGMSDCEDSPVIALMRCSKCGKESGWITFKNATQVKRGIPCDTCNESIN